MLKFTDFEWASFLYWAVSYGGNIGGDRDYVPLMSDAVFLERLRNHPEELTLKEIRDRVILFLNQWKCRIKDDDEIAEGIKEVLLKSKELLKDIEGKTLLDIDNLSSTQKGNIEELYLELDTIPHFSSTAISKTMHVLKADLFVMWDNFILSHYSRENQLVKATGKGYNTFLSMMSRIAHEVTEDFHKSYPDSTPEEFLCDKLGYKLKKPLAKFIDEYNWITITKGIAVPPRWWPEKAKS